MICPILIEYLNKILYLHLKYLRSTTVQLIYEFTFEFWLWSSTSSVPESELIWKLLTVLSNLRKSSQLRQKVSLTYLIWNVPKIKSNQKISKTVRFWRNYLFWSGHVGPEKSKQTTKIQEFSIFPNFSCENVWHCGLGWRGKPLKF